ncbi:MAG: hypothetical protein B6A08_15785 [Sorangiineae bacterium NIC37A_2]|nr:MAG: hypothetical protein B6A08_15785 [Sorangiineae bacterium NIC37A_2]
MDNRAPVAANQHAVAPRHEHRFRFLPKLGRHRCVRCGLEYDASPPEEGCQAARGEDIDGDFG